MYVCTGRNKIFFSRIIHTHTHTKERKQITNHFHFVLSWHIHTSICICSLNLQLWSIVEGDKVAWFCIRIKFVFLNTLWKVLKRRRFMF